MKTSAYTLLLFLCACSNGKQKDGFTYVVSNFSKSKDLKGQPLPSIPFYAPFNFILDTAGNLFYYQQQRNILECGTDYDYHTPAYIGLRPQDIVQLPSANLLDFIRANVLSIDKDYRIVSIASIKDTLNSNNLKVLMDSFSDTANHTRYYLRRATQEETVVLDYKQRQAIYNVDEIAWDSGRIRFMPKLTYEPAAANNQ